MNFFLKRYNDYKRENVVLRSSYLLEGLLGLFAGSLYSELCAKDVAKLSTISIAST